LKTQSEKTRMPHAKKIRVQLPPRQRVIGRQEYTKEMKKQLQIC
jgi:hypothetical protein